MERKNNIFEFRYKVGKYIVFETFVFPKIYLTLGGQRHSLLELHTRDLLFKGLFSTQPYFHSQLKIEILRGRMWHLNHFKLQTER